MVDAQFMYFSSSKDKNPIRASIQYFRVIEKCLGDLLCLFKVFLFKCKWIGSNIGVQTNELGFTRLTFIRQLI